MGSTIGKRILFAIMVILLPLAAIVYMIFAGMTAVYVENDGTQDLAFTVVNRSGRYIETSDIRTAPAGGIAYIILSPKMAGNAGVVCAPAARVRTGTAAGGVPLTLASAPAAFGGAEFAFAPVTPDGFFALHVRVSDCRVASRKFYAIGG